MGELSQSSYQAPTTTQVEIVFVRLPDGRVVARTPAELAELPADLLSELVLLKPQG